MHLCCFPVWWLVILVSLGQYVHLPSLVQTLGFSVTELGNDGGKDILLDVRMSLKLGSLLKPISDFCGKIYLSPHNVLLCSNFCE